VPDATIAFLIPSFDGGGAEAMTIRLSGELARRGRRVDLVTFRPEGENAARVPDTVRLVDLKVRRLLLAPLAIRRYLRAERPAVLVTALVHANVFALVGRLLAPGCGTALIVTERNMLSVHARHSRRWSRRLFKPAARLLYRFADRVVGISRGVAEDIRSIARLPPEKVSFIHNPAMSPDCIERSLRPIERVLAPPSDGPVIITAGRLDPQKDHATLLRAFARLVSQRPARLVILGQGPLRASLEDLARRLGVEDRVALPGYVEEPLPHLRSADLFVLSSIYEGFGNVLVEALACGLPVVSTDCPSGPSEILDGGAFGRLVPPGDVEALAAALLEALAEPRRPAEQQRRAREFTLERCADRFESLIDEVLRARRPPPARDRSQIPKR
jgi:glycosyltransferase involved in cell wall biosynthesis